MRNSTNTAVNIRISNKGGKGITVSFVYHIHDQDPGALSVAQYGTTGGMDLCHGMMNK